MIILYNICFVHLVLHASCIYNDIPLVKTLTRSMECVLVCFSYLTQLAVLHPEPQALSVGQRVASLGRGGLAGRRRRAVAHRPPSRYHHLAAGLVLIQCTLTSINHPETGYKQV